MQIKNDITYSDLIHVSITSSSCCGCRRSSSVAGLRGGRGVKVVSHLRVEFLLGLLGGTAVATTALLASSSLGSGTLGSTSIVLVSSSGLWLSFRLAILLVSGSLEQGNVFYVRGALSKCLDSRDNLVSLGSSDNDLNLFKSVTDAVDGTNIAHLDRSVVDKEAVQFLEGLASAIRLMKGHVCDTTAL